MVLYLTKKRVLFKKGCFIGPQNHRFWLKRGVFASQNPRIFFSSKYGYEHAIRCGRVCVCVCRGVGGVGGWGVGGVGWGVGGGVGGWGGGVGGSMKFLENIFNIESSGSCGHQMGPMMAPWILLSGISHPCFIFVALSISVCRSVHLSIRLFVRLSVCLSDIFDSTQF